MTTAVARHLRLFSPKLPQLRDLAQSCVRFLACQQPPEITTRPEFRFRLSSAGFENRRVAHETTSRSQRQPASKQRALPHCSAEISLGRDDVGSVPAYVAIPAGFRAGIWHPPHEPG